MMRFFGLKTCDTCRKALSALRQVGHSPVVVDVRDDGLQPDDIAAIIAAFGDAAVNRSSTTWRSLDEGERVGAVADLLARYPTLMKRPVIESDGYWTQGWDKSVQSHYRV
jgi:arsenate reductase-like glutaredoxin family protein